jgi:hypothetical protein
LATSFTLATLKTQIQNHAEDQGSEFASELDTLIQLGEDAIVRDLPLSTFDSRAAVSIVAGTQTATKPTDTITVRELYYTSAGARVILMPRSYSFCLDYAPTTTQAAPKYFADEYSETEVYIAPNPNVTVTAEAYITKRPTSLVTNTSGTFISKNLGDLLLAACMISAERYIIALEQLTDWKAAYQTALLSAAVDLRHLIRRDYSMLAPTPKAAGNPER